MVLNDPRPSAAATACEVIPLSTARVLCGPRMAWAVTFGTPAARQILCTHFRGQSRQCSPIFSMTNDGGAGH